MNKQPLTVMMVAGEASGDQHAAHMFLELRKQLPDVKGIGMGGSKMQAAGVDIRYDSSNIAVIGVIEVLKHYPEIRRALNQMQQLLLTERPDLLICVDYKEFNFKLAGYAKSIGIKVLFYVSPQIWAWREGRVVKYGKVIDAMAVIFPFEVVYYERHQIPVRYVGHPSVDKVHPQMSLANAKKKFGLTDNGPVVGLVPGSRHQEIKRLLPVMLLAARKIQETIPDVQFLLPQANTISDSLLQTFIQDQSLIIKTIKKQPYDVMQCCDVIITTSGTATLEIALLETPMVIVYKLAYLTYLLGRILVKTPFIGLPNIIAGHSVVKEFIQNQANPVNIAEETIHILQDQQYAQEIKIELKQIKKILGNGHGSKNTADFALQLLRC